MQKKFYRDGRTTYYYKNGYIKEGQYYKKGELVNTTRYTEEDKHEVVLFIVEEMPKFVGGESKLREYIATSVKYPKEAQKKETQGRVYVQFVIDKNGQVKNTKIASGVDPLLDKEAIRVASQMPKWIPEYQKGKAVNVSYTVPINFVLK